MRHDGECESTENGCGCASRAFARDGYGDAEPPVEVAVSRVLTSTTWLARALDLAQGRSR